MFCKKKKENGYWQTRYARIYDPKKYEIGKEYIINVRIPMLHYLEDFSTFGVRPCDKFYEVSVYVDKCDGKYEETKFIPVRELGYNKLRNFLFRFGVQSEEEYEDSKRFFTYDNWNAFRADEFLKDFNLSVEYKARVKELLLFKKEKFTKSCEKIVAWNKEVSKDILIQLIETQL